MDATSETDHQLIYGAYTIYIHVKESNNLLLCLVSLYFKKQLDAIIISSLNKLTQTLMLSSAFHPVCCT